MNFIVLTNVTKGLEGKDIAINADTIVSIFEVTEFTTKKIIKRKYTQVYCPPHASFEVEESLEEVLQIIKGNT